MTQHLKHQLKKEAKITKDNPFNEVIRSAYEAFKQSPPNHLGVYDCRMYPEYVSDFFNHDPNDIPLDYINDWFFAAADVPLDISVWRYLLPRVLEILATGEEPSNVGIEVSLSRYPTGKASNWNDAEWAVLNEFRRLFVTRFDLRPDDCLDDVICMFANAGWPVESLFSQILELPTGRLIDKLWSDWCDFPNPNIWISAFWEYTHIPREFYTSNELTEKIMDFSEDLETSAELSKKATTLLELMTA